MNYKLFSLVSGTLILSSLSASGQKNNTKPNILFILCDDMGYGDLGCYGQPFIRSPPSGCDGKRGYALHTGIRRKSRQCSFPSFIYDRAAYRTLRSTGQQGILDERPPQ